MATEKYVYRKHGVVEINAKVTLMDDKAKALEVDANYHILFNFGEVLRPEVDVTELGSGIMIAAAKTEWIKLQGFFRKHWKEREELRGKTVTMAELSEFYQKHSSGGGGIGLTATARALVATGKYTSEQAKEICADEKRKAAAEAWLKSLEVPAF